jgi:hypothetical protein
MASITTILGTDSVSSSRIVINNNFAALNAELADIAALFDTSAQTLTLTGQVQGGTLKINNGSIDTFKVNNSTAEVNVPVTFNQDVILGNALMHSFNIDVATLPGAGAYNHTTYILDATAFSNPILLADALPGQEITLIANGGTVEINTSNIAGITDIGELYSTGSLTLRYNDETGFFYIISAHNCLLPND